jgi:hypothetical protein
MSETGLNAKKMVLGVEETKFSDWGLQPPTPFLKFIGCRFLTDACNARETAQRTGNCIMFAAVERFSRSLLVLKCELPMVASQVLWSGDRLVDD